MSQPASLTPPPAVRVQAVKGGVAEKQRALEAGAVSSRLPSPQGGRASSSGSADGTVRRLFVQMEQNIESKSPPERRRSARSSLVFVGSDNDVGHACAVCFSSAEDFEPGKGFVIQPCCGGRSVCFDCCANHVRAKVEDRVHVVCPCRSCTVPMRYIEIKEYLDKDELALYNRECSERCRAGTNRRDDLLRKSNVRCGNRRWRRRIRPLSDVRL